MKRFSLLLALLCTVSCASAPPRAADLILSGGKVFTGDGSRPWAESVAIRGDRIVAVGSVAEVRALAGPSTRVVELAGRLVIPGVNDAHVHAPWPRETVTPVRLPREGVTKESLLAAVRDAATTAGTGSILVAELPLALVDAGISRVDLDAISASVPIRLTVFGGHSAILNTPALRTWGVDEDAADPAGGWYGRRDGKLDGWLYEHAFWVPQNRVAALASDDDLLREIREFEEEALGYGITSVQTMAIVPPDRLRRLVDAAHARLRWRIIDFRMAPFDASPSSYPVKYVVDGTPIERSAALAEPYTDDASTRGRLNYEDGAIATMVRNATTGGSQLLVHAVGDRTLDALLGSMERTRADWPSRRVRIEHGDVTTPELAARARELGVVIVQNPAHFMIPEVMHARLGDARAAQLQPARSLVAAGNHFALGSDGPLNPYLNMFFAAIHPTNPAESLTVEQSLRAYTSGAAYAEFEESRKGTIAPGMLADLAVLSHDIFAVAPDALPATTSVMTIVGGRVVRETTP